MFHSDDLKHPLKSDIAQYLFHLLDAPDTQKAYDFITHSQLFVTEGSNEFCLNILVDPEIYKKYQNRLKEFQFVISEKFEQFTDVYVREVRVLPDLQKFQILDNRYTTIVTPWEAINNGQSAILEQLRKASEPVDLQNIGNSCRTLLQNLANIVFIPAKHIANEPGIKLSEGDFKNRLHTYIVNELSGKKFQKMRGYADALVNTTDKAVDLTNGLTHNLQADKVMAEYCVIGTISVISLIKLVNVTSHDQLP